MLYGAFLQGGDWGAHDDPLIDMDAHLQEPVRVVCDRNDVLGSILPMKVVYLSDILSSFGQV